MRQRDKKCDTRNEHKTIIKQEKKLQSVLSTELSAGEIREGFTEARNLSVNDAGFP